MNQENANKQWTSRFKDIDRYCLTLESKKREHFNTALATEQ